VLRLLPFAILGVLLTAVVLAVSSFVPAIPDWILPFVLALLTAIGCILILRESLAYSKSHLGFHKEYLHYHSGWWVLQDVYVRRESVKDLATKQYWLTTFGELTVNIAGQEYPQEGQDQVLLSQHFTAPYLPEAFAVHDTLIDELGGDSNIAEVLSTKPHARNTVLAFTIVIFLIPFIPFLVWSYSKRSYHIYSDRIEFVRGVMSRTRMTILYNMLDHVRSGQGFFNKIFGNGQVAVYTTGSSTVELVIGPVPNHEKIADVIREHYK
jgi:membrane protein YdbS with pleckstrin-like domain